MPIESDPIGVAILGMIDARTAGVTLTANPNTGDESMIVIEANWGLGESVVSGFVTPDCFILDKGKLKILEKKLGDKNKFIRCTENGIAEEDIPQEKRSIFCLTDEEVKEIGRFGKLIEEYFKGVPQDIEWAVTGPSTGKSDVFFPSDQTCRDRCKEERNGYNSGSADAKVKSEWKLGSQ